MMAKPKPDPLEAVAILAQAYGNRGTALNYATPWQLLVATMLSAQCTDQRVNMITPRIFSRYPDARALAEVPVAEIEDLIRDCGLFRMKAKNLSRTARIIAEDFGGDVPADRDLLMTLPGVGRKTANVVVANAFGQDAIAVDTHVFRVAHRLGWSSARDPQGTEQDLMQMLPKTLWSQAHHWLIWHGREVCHARRPACGRCPLVNRCPQVGVPKGEEG